MNDIIVSIDRSDAARGALPSAAELATSAGANLHVDAPNAPGRTSP